MKKRIYGVFMVVLMFSGLFLGRLNHAEAQDEDTVSEAKGTLYGNPEGTKFCCKSGTNSCSAADCDKKEDNF